MYPVIIITLTAILSLYLGLYPATRGFVQVVNLLGLLAALIVSAVSWNFEQHFYNDMMRTDHYSIAFSITLIASTGLIIGISKKFLETISDHIAEYYSIIMFSLAGGLIMVGFQNLTMLFVGLEILSVSVYILAGIQRKKESSNESALKYFLMGSFFTAILLLGIAFLYGATGTFNISEIGLIIGKNQALMPFLNLGLGLVLIALCFKVSVAPFHFWTPDVYEGAPTLITAYMSTVVKIAGFGAFLRLFFFAFASLESHWSVLLSILAVLTLFIGNINALYQTNMKRMLAYSSISHAGYMLMAIVAMGSLTANAILMYSIGYSLATITAFGILMVVQAQTGTDDFSAFHGFARKNPWLAWMMVISMCSLAGIPLTAGFFGKFYIFSNIMEQKYIALAILGVINAILGIFYYFKVIISMFFVGSDHSFEKVSLPLLVRLTLILTSICTIILGFYPSLFANLLN
jgi:NADH-quinone oxidoreductase subunit N